MTGVPEPGEQKAPGELFRGLRKGPTIARLRIAAAVPICGGGDPSLVARFKHIPIHAFHGEDDDEVPVAATREMVAALEKAGGKPKMTIYPGVNHFSWEQTYDNPELIRYLTYAAIGVGVLGLAKSRGMSSVDVAKLLISRRLEDWKSETGRRLAQTD